MPHHKGLCTLGYQPFIYRAVGLIPLFAGKVVYRRAQMLVTLVPAVAGEVLHRYGKPAALALLCITGSALSNKSGVGAICAGIGYGIAKIVVDIADGGEGVVCAHSFALFGARLGKPCGISGVARRSYHHL